MCCPEELALVERALDSTAGVEHVLPDYFAHDVRVEFDPTRTDPGAIERAIEAAGFDAQAKSEMAADGYRHQSDGQRAGLFGDRMTVVGGATLLAAAALRVIAGETTWYVVLTAVISTMFSGASVVRAASRALRLRMLDMNVLMTIAATGALAIGDVFEAATAMFLFAVSLWLERMSLSRAQRAIRSLVALNPTVAHRLSGGAGDGVVDVNPNELRVGDRVLVRPGERIAADGEVLAGSSAVNQAPITGESVPVEKSVGDRLFAGTLNGEGALTLRVTRGASDSTLAHIARLVDEARSARSPTERFVDQFARRYTPAVIAIALCVMIAPPLLSGMGVQWAAAHSTLDWIHRGLVLLVIACPCALVISTPVTIVSGLHQATRRGILIKGGEFLEKAAEVRTLALDKTGTVTTGAMEVVGVEPFNGHSGDDVLSLAAALERYSEHPLAVAVTAAAAARDLPTQSAASVSALRGLGVQGQLNGERYFLGNARLFAQSDFQLPDEDRQRILSNGQDATADTSAWLGTSRRLLGVIRLADRARPEAAQAIAAARRLGVRRVVMLTGDNAAVAKSIAGDLGIDEVYSDLLPQDKIALVQKLRRESSLAMVGDGVNDAPALAAADLGIALGGQSSDTAMETADVVIMSPDLRRVPTLIRLSRRCRRLLKQNISFALATKLGVMCLAAAGAATMWMAVAADVGASMVVIANGMRMIEGRKTED